MASYEDSVLYKLSKQMAVETQTKAHLELLRETRSLSANRVRVVVKPQVMEDVIASRAKQSPRDKPEDCFAPAGLTMTG